MYGGFGYYTRAAGLLTDRVLLADVVLANGTVVTASNTSNLDLFWGKLQVDDLQGSSRNEARPCVEQVHLSASSHHGHSMLSPRPTHYQINFDSPLSVDEITSGFISWQQLGSTAPNELAMSTVLAPSGDGRISLTFGGSYYGTLAQFNSIIGTLLPNPRQSCAPRNCARLGGRFGGFRWES